MHASCPACRKRITIEPSVPSVSIENVIRSLIGTKPDDLRTELRQRLSDAEKQVGEILKKCGNSPWDWFEHQKPLYDAEDGVFRCPICVSEVSRDGSCTNPTCARVWELERDDHVHSAEDEDSEESDCEEEAGANEYDSQDSFICDEVERVSDGSTSSSASGDDVHTSRKLVRDKKLSKVVDRKVKKVSSEIDHHSSTGEEASSDTDQRKAGKKLKERRREIEKAKKKKNGVEIDYSLNDGDGCKEEANNDADLSRAAGRVEERRREIEKPKKAKNTVEKDSSENGEDSCEGKADSHAGLSKAAKRLKERRREVERSKKPKSTIERDTKENDDDISEEEADSDAGQSRAA